MKQYLINIINRLKEAIRKGILWIFPRLDKVLLGTILLTLFCILVGCGTQRRIYGELGRTTQLVHDIRVDTIYMNSQQYDSIYIYQDRLLDRSKDTVYLKDVSVEYRYKLLRDTVRIVQRDSIPYEVTVIETKEITRPKTTFDIISYWCFGIVVGMILFLIYRIIRKFIL